MSSFPGQGRATSGREPDRAPSIGLMMRISGTVATAPARPFSSAEHLDGSLAKMPLHMTGKKKNLDTRIDVDLRSSGNMPCATKPLTPYVW